MQEVLISTDPVKDEDVIILPKPQPEEPPAVTSKRKYTFGQAPSKK